MKLILGSDRRSNTALECSVIHGQNICRIFPCDALLIQTNNHDTAASISRLFVPRRPIAILWSVVAVIVAAFKRMPIWARSHVTDKRGEVMLPSITDSDTSPSIPFIRSVGRIKATRLHARPRRRELMRAPIWRKAVFAMERGAQTATTFCVASSQRIRRDYGDFSAVALTFPRTLFLDAYTVSDLVPVWLEDSQRYQPTVASGSQIKRKHDEFYLETSE
jgi:hypothetical protein